METHEGDPGVTCVCANPKACHSQGHGWPKFSHARALFLVFVFSFAFSAFCVLRFKNLPVVWFLFKCSSRFLLFAFCFMRNIFKNMMIPNDESTSFLSPSSFAFLPFAFCFLLFKNLPAVFIFKCSSCFLLFVFYFLRAFLRASQRRKHQLSELEPTLATKSSPPTNMGLRSVPLSDHEYGPFIFYLHFYGPLTINVLYFNTHIW